MAKAKSIMAKPPPPKSPTFVPTEAAEESPSETREPGSGSLAEQSEPLSETRPAESEGEQMDTDDAKRQRLS